jgi:predicted phage-related endonuclease
MLSASRLPAVLGLSKWSNPNDELEYSINALKGLERPDIGNEAMAWGNTLEPIVLAEAAKRLLLQNLWTEHEIPYFHPTLPLCCSLDGTAGGRGQVVVNDPANGIFVIGQDSITLDGMGVIEAKVTSVDPEDAPALYRGPIQLQAQMDIVKATWGCIAVLYKASELRLFLFAMHQPTLDRIAAATIDFQSRLDNWKETGSVDFYPPASGERWPDTRGLYPADDNVITLDSMEAAELAERIANNKLGLKITEQEIASDEERLKELMGTNIKAIAGGFTINWPVRSYKAQPEKVSPAKEAYSVRQSTLTIKETK